MKTSALAFKKWNRQNKHFVLLATIMWLWFGVDVALLMSCNGEGKLAEFGRKRYEHTTDWPVPPMVIPFVLALIFSIRANETADARDKVRKVFQNDIINALGIKPTIADFDRAKKIEKYLWRNMTEEEKQQILGLYKKTSLYGNQKFDDTESRKEFITAAINIANAVIAREQNAMETLTAIANKQTCMHAGWNCGNVHGGQ